MRGKSVRSDCATGDGGSAPALSTAFSSEMAPAGFILPVSFMPSSGAGSVAASGMLALVDIESRTIRRSIVGARPASETDRSCFDALSNSCVEPPMDWVILICESTRYFPVDGA